MSHDQRTAGYATRYAWPVVFVMALALLWLRLGHWFYLSIDEGIYLEGGRRVAGGQVPYRDFFVVTGPGSFWLYGAVFHFFGTTLANARFVLCCELAAICAAICSIVGRLTSVVFGTSSAALFLAMLLTTPYPLYVTHRWDSNALALLALALVVPGTAPGTGTRVRIFAAGACAGTAVCVTPPILFVVILLVAWLAWTDARTVRHFAVGLALPLLAAAGVLVMQGAFGDFVRTVFWDASNYSSSNSLTYGALTGSFQSFRRAGLPAGLAAYFDALWPVLLPPLAALACLRFHAPQGDGEKRFLWLLGAASVASLAACYPRFGAAQLLFGSAFLWVFFCCAIGSLVPRLSYVWVALCVLLAAAGWPKADLRRIETPVGTLNVSKLHHVFLNNLLAPVKPGQDVFVYPYLPALYFALGVENPTRYSWLQPGMMGPRDVESVLASLRAKPPRWIIWHDFTREFILKNWPSSDRARLRFPEMESYFSANYHVVTPDGVVPLGYRLLEHNQ